MNLLIFLIDEHKVQIADDRRTSLVLLRVRY